MKKHYSVERAIPTTAIYSHCINHSLNNWLHRCDVRVSIYDIALPFFHIHAGTFIGLSQKTYYNTTCTLISVKTPTKIHKHGSKCNEYYVIKKYYVGFLYMVPALALATGSPLPGV